MRVYDIILKKRNGEKLSSEEIDFLVQGYSAGKIPDYQMSAWAMAVYFSGLDEEETAALTMSMVNSGDKVDLSSIPGIKIDKHSTGGVGDKTTLILVPLVSSAGIHVAKMSGRGLGHTGGTLDKLEAIPGFQVAMEKETFIQIVKKVGCAVVGQTGNLVPADKKLYALRDVTATVDIISLIASSVMSKKIAAGADKILLDVKAGDGAFVKTVDDAFELAKIMVKIGEKLKRETMALISSMEQPLGRSIGNALEVKEAIETLQGKGPEDLTELCLELGARIMLLAKKAVKIDEGKEILREKLYQGKALEKFAEMVKAQNGDINVIDDVSLLPQATVQLSVNTEYEGFVHSIKAEKMGIIAMTLGAGREKKEDTIDPAVGIVIHKKVADKVNPGESIATVHARNEDSARHAAQQIKLAYEILPEEKRKPQFIFGQVTPKGVECL
ncbi:MAG: pyrimidine-nucleoside phosphorylase [Clostridia bacterium]|nr:pyrimidine-nucleoside phosphorylase [Clostridia bacterium]